MGTDALQGWVWIRSTAETDALQVRDWYSPGLSLIYAKNGECYSPEVRTDSLQVGTDALQGWVRMTFSVGMYTFQDRDRFSPGLSLIYSKNGK